MVSDYVSRGGLYWALARMADRAQPTYDHLVEAARQTPVNGMDETGWKVGGRLQWLNVAVSAQVTVYARAPNMMACSFTTAGHPIIDLHSRSTKVVWPIC